MEVLKSEWRTLTYVVNNHYQSGALRIFWFIFFQKHRIWPRSRPCHTVWIFDGRQDRHPMGPTYWQNTKWPPSGWHVNFRLKTKRANHEWYINLGVYRVVEANSDVFLMIWGQVSPKPYIPLNYKTWRAIFINDHFIVWEFN